MQVLASPAVMQQQTLAWRTAGETIVFVPTMGALHDGHGTLLHHAQSRGSRLVVSIFVNPTQFGPHEDLANYPRTLETDLERCRHAEVDAVFTPTVETIYPEHYQTFVEVTALSQGLCGAVRPGHFRGVVTVVLKLFHIMQPHVALFGEKDYQQLHIIRRMAQDLLLPIEIIGVPTLRDADGLAVSSRNRYLSPTERTQARAIPRALTAARALAEHTRNATELCDVVREQLRAAQVTEVDYVTMIDADTLAPLPMVNRPARLCLAVRIGQTRLIDNIAIPMLPQAN